MMPLRMEAVGDQAMRVVFGENISLQTNRHIRVMVWLLQRESIEGVSEWVPSYTALTIYYNPVRISFTRLRHRLLQLNEKAKNVKIPPSVIYHIPVCYGEDWGPDLQTVASRHNMKPEDVIRLHTAPFYLIYMLGFTPGFPYLGGMNKKLSTPRLATPRSHVPAGSVGIAGEQTGIYSLDSPGGWNIIGRTPLQLFDPSREKPVLFEAGDFLRFVPISAQEFDRVKQKVESGNYEVDWEKEEET